jgi:hypothetical protein
MKFIMQVKRMKNSFWTFTTTLQTLNQNKKSWPLIFFSPSGSPMQVKIIELLLDLHNYLANPKPKQKLAFNLLLSKWLIHASENNRTTFGPPQPPCKLKPKQKCVMTPKKKRPTTMAQNRKENTHNTPTPNPK